MDPFGDLFLTFVGQFKVQFALILNYFEAMFPLGVPWDLWGSLGIPWGSLGDPLKALGDPRESLGVPCGRLAWGLGAPGVNGRDDFCLNFGTIWDSFGTLGLLGEVLKDPGGSFGAP